MTTKAKKKYHKFKFNKNDILLFGRESAGVPENLHKTINNRLKVPMNKKTRSLNVAMSVAIISAEALRQNKLIKIMINSEFKKKMADSWFSYLQIQICKSFERLKIIK